MKNTLSDARFGDGAWELIYLVYIVHDARGGSELKAVNIEVAYCELVIRKHYAGKISSRRCCWKGIDCAKERNIGAGCQK